MSIRITNTTIQVSDSIELDELCIKMGDRLLHYAKRHSDFTVVLEKNIEDNQLIIKSLFLEEHVN